MRPATSQEIARWDELVAANPDKGAVLQLRAFGETKNRHGWQAKYFMYGSVAVLVLSRRIPGFGELWYVPNGPGVADGAGLAEFIKAAKKFEPAPFVIKLDPEILKTAISTAELRKTGLQPAPRNLQYNISTVIVDLRPDPEEILAGFKQKTRYNVRLAERKGVTVTAVPADAENMAIMYRLYGVTTKRAGVYLRSRSYFTDFWRLHAESGHGQLFLASYQNQVLAGAYITFIGNKALYKDGGSVREHNEVQAPYALQWYIMQWLKAHGVERYDLHGVPPADRLDDPTHPLAGLARFKTGFQSEPTEFIGTYDLVLNQVAYRRWNRFGERLAMAYEARLRHRLFY